MNSSLQAHWDDVLNQRKTFTQINSASMLLAWDQETKMPAGAGAHRAETMAVLSALAHERATSSQYGEALGLLWEEAQSLNSELDFDQQAIVRELWRDYSRQSKLPGKLVEEMTKTTSLSQQAWSEARQKEDPSLFLPWLEKTIALAKEAGAHLREEGQSSYDALLDEYEPGARSADLKVLFQDLVADLVPLVKKIESRPEPQSSVLSASWDVQKQEKWSRFLLDAMGFDFDRGRLDVSEHPFTEGVHTTDVRLTTRYSEKEFFDSLFSTVHEGGHGLYEQGFLDKWSCTPLAEAISLGVHESQSRLWENQVARSEVFWDWAWPELQKFFPENLKGVGFDEFYRVVNKVKPGEIRVDADEVTYNLHIALRFQMEHELFDGGLQVSDVESRWNELSDQYLGLVPQSPMKGFMQDVHWSVGLFGYFPTYTLGNLMSAQLFQVFQSKFPNYQSQFKQGDFSQLKQWLNTEIHQVGKAYSANDLIQKVTGEPLQARYFSEYIKSKYHALYQIKS